MEHDEVIATSDCEELEALEALAPGYWSNVLSSSTAASRTASPSYQPSGDVEGSRPSYVLIDHAKTHPLPTESLSRSSRRGPPRKRPKVLHSTESMAGYSSLPSTPAKARYGYASGLKFHSASSSPSISQIRQLRELTIDRSLSPEISLIDTQNSPPNCGELISTAGRGEVAGEASGMDRLQFSIDSGRPKIMGFSSSLEASPVHVEDHLLRIHSAMHQSRSPSPDPLALFTPPKVSRNDPKPPSPLTPIPSPNLSNPALPQYTTRSSSPTPAQSIYGTDEGIAMHMLEAEQAQGRYSLRTRLARQKNPYAYDKAMYKRQMRSNPDAIVKVISPPRPKKHHRSKSRSERQAGSGEEAEDEFALDEGAGEDEEDEPPRRQKKSRSVSAGVGGQGHNRQGSSLTANRNSPNPPGRSQMRESWYPDAFNESFSSSSADEGLIDDPILSPKKRKRRSKEGAKLHRRRRPFPMKDLKKHSPLTERHVSLPPQSPAQTIDLTMDAASDDEVNMVLPRWRRRSMSRIPSHHSIPNSRSSSARNSPIYDNSTFDQEDYVFRHVDSAEPPPLSSTPTDFDAFLSQPEVGPVHSSGSKGFDSEAEILSDHSHDHQQNPTELSGEGSGSDQSASSTAMMTSQDRRRFKVLQRMMPRVLIQRHLQNPTARRPRATSDDHSEADDDGQPLRPGQSRVRIRGPAERTSIDIRGDSESSDIDMPEEGPRSSSSSSESDMDAMSPPPRLRKLSGLSFGAAGLGGDSDSGSDMVDGEIGQWVSESIRPPRRSGLSREAKEGDLIDRMLSRTRVTSVKHRRKHRSRRTDSRRRVSSSKTLHITTAGARKTGTGRQTLLPFTRAQSSQNGHKDVHSAGARNIHDQGSGEAIEVTVNSRKRKKQRNAGGLFTFSSGGGRLATGRSHNFPITIDAEEDYAVPSSNFVSNASSRPPSKFRVKPSLAKASARIETALDDNWNVDDDAIALPREATPQEYHHDLGTGMRRVTLDFDISLLPSGITFGPDSYLTRGRLHELNALLADGSGVVCPHPVAQFDIRLQSSMSSAEFVAELCKIRELACDMRTQRKELSTAECQQWQMLLHSTSQHLSWLLLHADETDRAALHVAVERHIVRLDDMLDEPTEIIPDDEVPYLLTYEIQWSTIEIIARVECDRRHRHCQADDATMTPHIRRFMRELWGYGFLDLLHSFVAENEDDHANNPMSRRIAELWVCLVHFIDSWSSNTTAGPRNPPTSFWNVYLGAVRDVDLLQAASDLAASEMIWRSIFTLCSLSQFSVYGITTSTPRLGASWELISAALERIRLTADPVSDGQLPKRSLHKRDEYIRMLVSRCFILGHRWRWPLDDASILFGRLLEIFKSRRFANLSDEPSDFPSFLRHSNLQLLSENKRSDTAFTLLLKLIVQAAKDSGRAVSDSSQGRNLSPKLKKLLSLCVPVGSVPFTKATPPTPHELSMLYNRFSAVAVAVYLEPTVSNLKYRLANARRYVSFKDTDHETRRACIRGLMHLTILMRHLHLPLDDLVDWLAHMTDVLVDEYVEEKAAGHATSWVVLCIQLLLGCVRRIIETPVMDPAQNITHYPDPALLKGPWVTRIFAASTDLTTVATTRTEIRKLVQAFLNVRAMVIQKPARPRLAVVASKESQESQDDYGDIILDFDDPELLAALGDPSASPLFKENKEKDLLVSEIIDTHISPAIYRLVCKHFVESGGQSSFEEYSQDADDWVTCWVGCASVIVQNCKRDWSLYLALGPHSWQRIIDPFRRRRVGLRFMLTVLQLDPSAYPTYKDRFVDILLESIVTPKVTIEHEYMSLLLSIDGLRHPLLRDMPCEREEGMTDYKISRKEFLERRLSYAHTIFTNLADLIRQEAEGDTALMGQNQTCIGSIVAMLSTMQDNHQQLAVGTEEQSQYSLFCRKIHECLAQFPVLSTNSRLTTIVNWGNQLH